MVYRVTAIRRLRSLSCLRLPAFALRSRHRVGRTQPKVGGRKSSAGTVKEGSTWERGLGENTARKYTKNSTTRVGLSMLSTAEVYDTNTELLTC